MIKVAVPRLTGRIRLATYGKLEIWDVPSPDLVNTAIPAALSMIAPVHNKYLLKVSIGDIRRGSIYFRAIPFQSLFFCRGEVT
ncbi:MAG TPA: hypothetical protein PKO22_10605 [Treponemataceae bacterium]|nr:hypothetical protein [Treponemataceae bacterium]